jgi:diguanylate cyclase (GGDEF)-like protein/PAS domain S-box-containing protein
MFAARLPFRRQLLLGIIVVASVWLGAGALVYRNMLQVRDAMADVTERVNPAAVAAYEMEIQTVEVGLKVLKYMQRMEPQYRSGALKDMQQFDGHQRTYEALAADPAQHLLATQVKALFADYRARGLTLVDQTGTIKDLAARVRSGLHALNDRLLAEAHALEAARLPQSLDHTQLIATLELEVAEIGAAVGSYLQQPTPEQAGALEMHALKFDTALARLQRATMPARDSALLKQLAALWQEQRARQTMLVASRHAIEQDLTQFLALRTRLDDLLDETIQAHAEKSVATARHRARVAQDTAATTLLLGLGLAAAVSTLIYLRLSRQARSAMARFSEAAQAYGGGRLGHRIGLMGDPELDRLADAYHGMAQRLQDTTVSAQSLRESEGKLRAVLTQMDEGYYETDLRGRLIRLNPALAKILRCPEPALQGTRPLRLLSAAATSQVKQAFLGVLQTGQPRRDMEIAFNVGGGERTIALSVQLARDDAGQPIGFRGLAYDETERRRLEVSIERMVVRDALTGLPNRLMLQDQATQAVAAAAREHGSCSLLLIRIEGLSDINNALGHPSGDLLLSLIGMRLHKRWGDQGMLARPASDEFALLMPDCELNAAKALVGEVMEAFDAPFMLDTAPVHVGVSVGLALFPLHTNSADGLLRCAGLALADAHANQSGQATYQAHKSDAGLSRALLRGELRSAMDRGTDFSLHYQPKLRLSDNQPSGMEALARWRHPKHGQIAPDDFIPQLERRGLIGAFTLWAIETAAAQQRQWLDQGREVRIAVNVSPVALLDASFAQRVIEIVDRHGGPSAWLELEVTESTLMADPELMLSRLAPLLERGMRLSIDDFGTGYSSLSMLRRFKAHTLKIDRSFIRDLLGDPENTLIVQTIIGLAHSLGMTVVAEGAESDEVCHRLAELGCDEVQGFALGAPMPTDQATRWLRDVAPSSFVGMSAS